MIEPREYPVIHSHISVTSVCLPCPSRNALFLDTEELMIYGSSLKGSIVDAGIRGYGYIQCSFVGFLLTRNYYNGTCDSCAAILLKIGLKGGKGSSSHDPDSKEVVIGGL